MTSSSLLLGVVFRKHKGGGIWSKGSEVILPHRAASQDPKASALLTVQHIMSTRVDRFSESWGPFFTGARGNAARFSKGFFSINTCLAP